MKKKIIGILIVTLLIATAIPAIGTMNIYDVVIESANMNTQIKDQYQEQWQGAEHIVGLGSEWQEFKPGMAKFAELELKLYLVTAYYIGNLKPENTKIAHYYTWTLHYLIVLLLL